MSRLSRSGVSPFSFLTSRLSFRHCFLHPTFYFPQLSELKYMTLQETFEELKQLAEQMGLKVRVEMGDFDGGVCVVNDARVILVNRRHDLGRRINVVARALHEVGLNEVFVKPAVREV